MESRIELPAPAPEALAHSQRLARRIAERIRRSGGWLDFSEYMDMALYEPGLGYYSAGAQKFGEAGDFVTAPELSPVFGRCMGRVCAEELANLRDGVIVEVGGGSGALAVELLEELQRLGRLPDAYLMLEPSADLRERQRAAIATRLPQLAARVRWLDRLPESVEGVMLANEVADALPVSRFTVREGRTLTLGVGLAGAGFGWEARAAGEPAVTARGVIEQATGGPLDDGCTLEFSPRLAAWVAALAAPLRRGLLLVSDYGLPRRELYHVQRRHGTLVCHYRHRVHDDPFRMPGLQDITAWVDFTAVAEAAELAGLQVAGYCTQAHFLLAAGLGAVLAEAESGPDAGVALSRQLQTLLLPGQMGERFKVMALTRGLDGPVPGFSLRDLRHLL